jgi:hypothetical protein
MLWWITRYSRSLGVQVATSCILDFIYTNSCLSFVGICAIIFQKLRRVLLALSQTRKNLLNFRINFINILNSWIELTFIISAVDHLTIVSWGYARSWIDRTSHIIVVNDWLLHLSNFTYKNFFLLKRLWLKRLQIIFFINFSPILFEIIISDTVKFFWVDITFESAFLKSVDCKWFFKMISTKVGSGLIIWITIFHNKIVFFRLKIVLFGIVIWGNSLSNEISALFETLYSLPSRWSIILLFDFLDSWVSLNCF